MKKIAGYDKLRGGYYTPELIADFIVRWAIRSPDDFVLEPSCGDGSFLRSISNFLQKNTSWMQEHILGVELDSIEAKKAENYGATIVNADFFSYYQKHFHKQHTYDVVIGNPPFIRSQNFDEKYRKIAFDLMEECGLHPGRLTNIWIPFLVLSTCLLRENGRLGMVIPAELLQVDYASEVRKFLSDSYDSLTIITFKELLFPNAQQEVVLLLGEKNSVAKGIRTIEVQDAQELQKIDVSGLEYEVKELNHSTEKWTQYHLAAREILLLRQLRNDHRLSRAPELFDVNVGIVSGENDFFIIDKQVCDTYKLKDSTCPIVGRADQLSGINFTQEDFDQLISANRKVFLFTPPNLELKELSAGDRRYIKYGVSKKYNTGYKCKIRKKWYIVPQSWLPDAFMLRQVNKYPRIVLNTLHSQNTDTLHKIRFKHGVVASTVCAAFLNSFTLALCEIVGRSYGGGVLTFEPGEVRQLLIPMKGAETLDFDFIDKCVRGNRINDVLDYTDKILLEQNLGLDTKEILLLRGVWERLSNRRINRKKQRSTLSTSTIETKTIT